MEPGMEDDLSSCEELDTNSMHEQNFEDDLYARMNSSKRETEDIAILESGEKFSRYSRGSINGDVNVTLWQFLLELLVSGHYNHVIQWTNREGEFQLLKAEEVARLWGMRKNKNHRMNYDKLSRALRYYYQKNIIKKVQGQKFVYRFVGLSDAALNASRLAIANRNRKRANASPPAEDKAPHSDRLSPQLHVDLCHTNGSPNQRPEVPELHSPPTIKREPLIQNLSEPGNEPCCSCRCHSNDRLQSLENDGHPAPKKARVGSIGNKSNPGSPRESAESNLEDTARGVPSASDLLQFGLSRGMLANSNMESHLSSPRYYFQWLAAEVERANTSLSSQLHTNRHEANMKKLSDQIRLQKLWQRPDVFPSADRPASSSTFLPPFLPSEGGGPMEASATASSPYSLPGMPPCVWMPVPISMVSQVWPEAAGLGRSSSPLPQQRQSRDDSQSHNPKEASRSNSN